MKFKTGMWLSLLPLILSGALNPGIAAEPAFAQGLEAARAGDHGRAGEAFQSALAAQPAAGTLRNVGLVNWRSGQTGKAILCWEQSAWLDPFDGAARNNLRFARDAAQIEPPELTWCELSSTWLPARVWAGILCGCLWLAVGIMVLPGVLRLPKARWHAVVAALGLGAFLLSLPPNLGVVTRGRLGIVLEKKTGLRLTPTKESEIVAMLAPGEAARWLRQRGDYCLVRTPHGTGWIQRGQFGRLGGPLR